MVIVPAYLYAEEFRSSTSAGIIAASEQFTRIPRLYMQPLSSTSFVFTASAEPGAGTLVRAIYGTNWYVNATNGNDANSGASAALAKKTLAAAVAHAVPGDVVHAAEGSYDEGSMLHEGYVYVKDVETSASAPYIASASSFSLSSL